MFSFSRVSRGRAVFGLCFGLHSCSGRKFCAVDCDGLGQRARRGSGSAAAGARDAADANGERLVQGNGNGAFELTCTGISGSWRWRVRRRRGAGGGRVGVCGACGRGSGQRGPAPAMRCLCSCGGPGDAELSRRNRGGPPVDPWIVDLPDASGEDQSRQRDPVHRDADGDWAHEFWEEDQEGNLVGSRLLGSRAAAEGAGGGGVRGRSAAAICDDRCGDHQPSSTGW